VSDTATAQTPRVRVNAKEQGKGFTVEATVECYQGEDAPTMLAQKIMEVQTALRAKGLKLVADG